MPLFYSVKNEQRPGPPVRTDCGKCGGKDVAGKACDQSETLRLLGVIPILKIRNTFVTCGSCGAQLRSRLSCQELVKLEGADLRPFIFYEVSFVVKFLAIASILLCVFPLLGFLLALTTVCCTLRVRGWPKTLGLIALILSSLITIPTVVLLALGF
jgi:hypothetical protein